MKTKISRFIFILIGLSLLIFSNEVWASNYDIQIAPLYINGTYVKDIEIRQHKNTKLLLPVKDIAKVLEVEFSYDKLNKNIVIGNKTIDSSSQDVLYTRNSIIKDFYDDFFMSDSSLTSLLNTKISADSTNFTVNIETNKKLAILENILKPVNSSNGVMQVAIIKDIFPLEEEKFLFKSLRMNGSLNFNKYDFGGTETAYNNNTLMANWKMRVKQGDLEINNNFYAYDSKAKIGAIKFNYKKQSGGTKFEAGSLTPICLEKNGSASLAQGLVGVKVSKEKDNKNYTLYAGTTDYNAYMFRDYKTAMTKKIVLGASYTNKVNEKLSYTLSAIHDNIMGNAAQYDYYQQMLTNISPAMLSFSSYKNMNNVSGDTIFLNGTYKYNNSLLFEPSLGLSNAQDHSPSAVSLNGVGLGASIKTSFNKNKIDIWDKLYYYSPDFYFAGSTAFGSGSSMMNDRIGIQNGFKYSNKIFSLNARAENYVADLEHKLNVGNLLINDYNLSGRVSLIPKMPIDYSLFKRTSENNNGTFDILNGSIFCSRQIAKNLNGDINFNFFNTNLSNNSSKNTSLTKRNIIGVSYIMPKRLGTLRLEHEMTGSESNSKEINTSRIRVGYNFPSFKRFSPSLNVGLPYSGNVKGLDYNLSLAYRVDQGREIRASYYFNRQMGYMFDNIYIPSTSRSTFLINFTDNMSLYGGMKSLTQSTDDFGFIKVCTFSDKNGNGKFDKDEKRTPNMALRIQNIQAEVKTDKSGTYTSPALKEGKYEVSLNKEEVPSFYNTDIENENFCTTVEKNRVTNVYIPLISTPGNIYGKVKITDELGSEIKIEDIVVTACDEAGNEVAYTNVDEDMNFNITNLKPGKYSIKIDKEFQDAYCLGSKDEMSVEIPHISDESYVVDKLILNYKQKNYI